MSYAQHVTMLNELPELEDLETKNEGHPDYQKYIRNNKMQAVPQSGMAREAYHPPPPPQIPPQEMMMQPPSMNCLDIARHVQDCPICSKFYHNDRTVYVIAIVVLSIVCLLLLKKVLNV